MTRALLAVVIAATARKLGRMALNPLPLSITIRITSIMWAIGLNKVTTLAQSGMLSTGVNRPPMRMKIMTKKNITSMACCCVAQ